MAHWAPQHACARTTVHSCGRNNESSPALQHMDGRIVHSAVTDAQLTSRTLTGCPHPCGQTTALAQDTTWRRPAGGGLALSLLLLLLLLRTAAAWAVAAPA
jgi:hypothetical protein